MQNIQLLKTVNNIKLSKNQLLKWDLICMKNRIS